MLAHKPRAVNVKPHAHQAIHSRPERFVKNIAIADLAAPPLFEMILGIAEIDPLQALFDGILNGLIATQIEIGGIRTSECMIHTDHRDVGYGTAVESDADAGKAVLFSRNGYFDIITKVIQQPLEVRPFERKGTRIVFLIVYIHQFPEPVRLLSHVGQRFHDNALAAVAVNLLGNVPHHVSAAASDKVFIALKVGPLDIEIVQGIVPCHLIAPSEQQIP